MVITGARSLDRSDLELAANPVEGEGSKRLAVDVLWQLQVAW